MFKHEEKMISADKLKREIVKIKLCFHSENSGYANGYLSALSVVEGLIAYLTGPTNMHSNGGGNIFEEKTESGLLED